MLSEQIWIPFTVGFGGVAIGAALTWWARHWEATLALKRDVFRRIFAYRYRLVPNWKMRSGTEEPYIALNEAAVVFAKRDGVLKALQQLGALLGHGAVPDRKKESETFEEKLAVATKDLYERMARDCRLKSGKFDANSLTATGWLGWLRWRRLKSGKFDADSLFADPLRPTIHGVRSSQADLAAKREVLRRVMAYRHRLQRKLRPGEEEPYLALNEAAITFADCPEVVRAMGDLYKHLQGEKIYKCLNGEMKKQTGKDIMVAIYKTMAQSCGYPLDEFHDDYLLRHPIVPDGGDRQASKGKTAVSIQ